jgi:beta-lactamase superfamily II metal-dependent hydrolase
MADQLLIRSYNVGCGDCIYIRIPGGDHGFHILLDCGTKSGAAPLEVAVTQLKTMLPMTGGGKRRLDLMVATHRHEDHIKGFDPDWFTDVDVRHIWLSAVLDPTHPQSDGVNSLHALARRAMRQLRDSGQALSPEVQLLASLYSVSNEAADEMLMETLPQRHGITPRFMRAGDPHQLDLPADTAIHVLAPEDNIDGFYLGDDDALANGLQALAGAGRKARRAAASGPPTPVPSPTNISPTDFATLRSRMLSSGLAFAARDTSIQNNLSVVLLIEWKGHRLLFVGDAEWEGEFKAGKHNGSWNVMWEKHRARLGQPLDFLKIGHHGSINATPPAPLAGTPPTAGSVRAILDAILPLPAAGVKPTAQAIVSTERSFYQTIPDGPLLVELARRVRNTRKYGPALKKKGIDPRTIWSSDIAVTKRYFENFEKAFLGKAQPLRTDLEFALSGAPFLDVLVPPS